VTPNDATPAGGGGRELRNLLIPLADKVSLAADLHLPAGDAAVPVLISFNPYRKDDICGAFSEHWRRYFVGRGYGHLLVDVRGTGGSTGAIADTFHRQEGIDGAEVIEWAAAQPWCNGDVGVWGMSYAGGMVLAVASHRPPHLRAAASIYGFSDIYGDSTHPGGCPAALGRFIRETWMLALALAPPSYRDERGRWLEVWRERLANLDRTGPHSLTWRDHPDRDSFWQERAVDVERIEVPTFIIGGWRDIFPEAMVRTYERLSCPKKLLMGPWLHVSPDTSPVGPVDWLAMIADWWDVHLGTASPRPDEPAVTLFVQGSDAWRHEKQWPIARTSVETLQLAVGQRLVGRDEREGVDRYCADARVGATAGLWSPLGEGAGSPIDQGPDNLLSLTYTGDPLAQALEITGSPEALISVALVRGDDLDLVVKLQDVSPSGHAALITSGWLRGSHVDRDDQPTQLAEGDTRRFRVRLWATSYLVEATHRLRLAVSCSDFPRIWPIASSPVVDVHLGPERSFLLLPTVPPAVGGEAPPATMQQPVEDVDRDPWSRGGEVAWQITQDPLVSSVSVLQSASQQLELPDGTVFRVRHAGTATVSSQHPEEASVRATASIEVLTPGGERIDVSTRGSFSRSRHLFEGEVDLDGISFHRGRWRDF
jgi:hypothetical protein